MTKLKRRQRVFFGNSEIGGLGFIWDLIYLDIGI